MLIINYGFALADNPCEKYEISSRIPDGVPFRQERLAAARAFAAPFVTDLFMHAPECNTQAVLGLLRLASMTPEELGTLKTLTPASPAIPGEPPKQIPRISLANDMVAHNALVDELGRVSLRLKGNANVEGGRYFGNVESDVNRFKRGRVDSAWTYREQASAIVEAALDCAMRARENAATECIAENSKKRVSFREDCVDVQPDNLEDYLAWINESGGSHSAKVHTSGLVSSGLRKGEAAIFIPTELLISADVARRDAVFSPVLGAVDGLDDDHVMMLYIMWQKGLGEKGKWSRWFKALPKRLSLNLRCGGSSPPIEYPSPPSAQGQDAPSVQRESFPIAAEGFLPECRELLEDIVGELRDVHGDLFPALFDAFPGMFRYIAVFCSVEWCDVVS